MSEKERNKNGWKPTKRIRIPNMAMREAYKKNNDMYNKCGKMGSLSKEKGYNKCGKAGEKKTSSTLANKYPKS